MSSITSGLLHDKAGSTRVSRPPGGASSDIFGTSTETTSKPKNRSQAPKDSGIFSTTATATTGMTGSPSNGRRTPVPPAPDARDKTQGFVVPAGSPAVKLQMTGAACAVPPNENQESDTEHAEHEKPAGKSKSKPGYNPITGHQLPATEQVAAQPRTKQPPGGFSTKLW